MYELDFVYINFGHLLLVSWFSWVSFTHELRLSLQQKIAKDHVKVSLVVKFMYLETIEMRINCLTPNYRKGIANRL